jgi:hypothetical protein
VKISRLLNFTNDGMFIHPCCHEKMGNVTAYWALVESYRTANGPRQKVLG